MLVLPHAGADAGASATIDEGILTAGLLAHVAMAKDCNHLELYRPDAPVGRASLDIPRSALTAWFGATGTQLMPVVDALRCSPFIREVLQADETSISVLEPCARKTYKAYAAGVFEPIRAVVYDFAEARAEGHAPVPLSSHESGDEQDAYA